MAKPGGMPVGNQKGLGELWARLRFLFLAIVIFCFHIHLAYFCEIFLKPLGIFNIMFGGK